MIKFKPTSIKELNRRRLLEEQRDTAAANALAEIAELQDAVIEIADIVAGVSAAAEGGENNG